MVCTSLYSLHATTKFSIISKQISNKTPAEIDYPGRFVFVKEVNTQNFWTFELRTQEGINIPIWIFVVFQHNDRQHG